MNQMVQNMTGMGAMTEQVIATDFLVSAKSGIKNIALAITECTSPELREALIEQLNSAIQSHEQISNYMISKGFYNPHDIREQLTQDLKATQTALNLPNQ